MAGVSWEELMAGIDSAFSSERVDIDEVKRLMASYRSDQDDWGRFAIFDPHRLQSLIYRTWVHVGGS